MQIIRLLFWEKTRVYCHRFVVPMVLYIGIPAKMT
jgi:hypothetical protein